MSGSYETSHLHYFHFTQSLLTVFISVKSKFALFLRASFAVESLLLWSHMVTRIYEPARPDPTMTLFDGLFDKSIWRYDLKFLHYIVTGYKTVVSRFDRATLNDPEVIVFFGKTNFCLFHVHICV